MLAGILLVFIGLILFRPLRFNLGWSLDVKDWLHWAGITALVLLSVTTVITLRWFRHNVNLAWMNIHCISSALSAGLALVHSRTRAAVILPLHYHSYLTLGLLLLLTVSGALIRLYPSSIQVRKYWRIFHLPISMSFYVSLLYHVVLKLGVI
jgi:hypothetical protein